MQIIEIYREHNPNFSIIVSDGKEHERLDGEAHDRFLEEVESFINQRYGEHVSIIHKETILIEYNGSAWVELSSKTSGIMEMISEEHGLTIK